MSTETIHPGPSPEQLATVHPINAEVEAAMQAAQQPEQAIGDIVNVDANERGHRPDGKFLSDYEMTAIAAHQDQIREGLPALAKDRASDLVDIDGNNRAHRSNGQFLSNNELVQIDAHRDQIREGIAARKLDSDESTPASEEDKSDAELARELAEERRLLKEALEASKARTSKDPELAAIEEPVEDASAQGLRSRVKRIFDSVSKRLGIIQANIYNTVQQKSQEQAEEGWTTRRKLMGYAIGATVAAGAVVLAYKGLSGHHGAESAVPTPTGTGGSGAGHEAAKHVVSLHQGQNPWTVSEHQLKLHGIHNPTDAQIQAYDEKLLKLNDITPAGAHELPVGFHIQTLNEHQIQEALSKVA